MPAGLGEILPGALFQSLRERYPTTVRLPAADIPRPIALQNEILRYVPTIRMEAPSDTPFAVQVGGHMVSLNARRPYAGWGEFFSRIQELAHTLKLSGLIQKPERFSLKYVDLIELDPQPSLASLRVSLGLAGHDLRGQPTQLRTEIRNDIFAHIVQIATPADVTIPPDERRRGTLVDIDTICHVTEEFWERLDERVGAAHEGSKRLFLDLLTDEALERLGPQYG
jgi:uncharacterized protein (TIGR04255 family)